ncbi:MAG: hypothetical protein OEW31_01845 [Thermoleophilia bacterium]|nr:hypothetical protein [Thermoleophilia bacterium]
MDKLSDLSHGAKVVLGAAITFLIVSFFNWQEVSADLGPIGSVEAGQSMWNGIGVIAGLLAIVLVVWQAIRLANINVEIGVTPSMVTAALAVLLIIFTFIKFIADNEFRTFWAWLGLVLAIVVVVGAWMNMQAAGESLADVRSKVSSMTAAAGAGSSSQAPPPASAASEQPAPPAAPEPPAEAPPEEGGGPSSAA